MPTISFQIPESIDRHLRQHVADLNAACKEAALVEFYRQGLLTQHEFAVALGITRLEVDGILKRHNVTEDLMTIEEHDAEMESLRKLFGD